MRPTRAVFFARTAPRKNNLFRPADGTFSLCFGQTHTQHSTSICLVLRALAASDQMASKDNMTVPLGIVLNVVTVVGVIIVNKSLSANDGYNFMVFLSFVHFVFTAIGTRVMLYLNMFQYKDVNTMDMMPVALVS